MEVACALLPRFELISAVDAGAPGDERAREELLRRPVALAPVAGRSEGIGEISGQAGAHGLRPGMRLGEALSRCPELVLVPANPERTERAWEDVVRRLEGIGAAVDSGRIGEAFFEAGGLSGIWGGKLDGVLARARRAIGSPVRLAVASTRFCAYAAAGRARRGRSVIVPEGRAREFLAPLPVSLLRPRVGEELPETLERLGIRVLGKFALLDAATVSDRFGRQGLRALRLARGEDDALRPRQPREALMTELELPDAVGGTQLERAVELLVDRLLADPAREGRTIRRLRLTARLAGGGGWRCERVLRSASSSPRIARLALAGAIEELPAPAEALGLEAIGLGPPADEQLSFAEPGEERQRRLAEAVRQTRAAAGADAVLQVLDLDSESRLPERRAALTPFPDR